MSLYNALFGTNPFSTLLLDMLGIGHDRVPRFRDCYLSDDGAEIVIYTRTGGGNRNFYEHPDRCREEYPEYFGKGDDPEGPWNADLRKLAGYKCDADDDFDSTYAYFHYEIPPVFREQVDLLKNLGAVSDPAQAWDEMLTKLREGDSNDPAVQRAIKVAEPILGQIEKWTKAEGKAP